MKISVIIPSYNQAAFLPATLDSLASQVQTGPSLDVRIYDGGSTDESVDILREHPTRFSWISERDGGQANAINRGLRECTGDVIAYLNSDDIYYPDALRKVSAYFSDHPECAVLYGDAYHLHADGTVMESYYTESWAYPRLQEVCFLCQPAVFWRRSVVEQFGFFDDRLNYALDYDYWLRIGRHVPFHYMRGEYLAGSRLHADTKTLSQRTRVHQEILDTVIRHAGSEKAVLGWLGHLAHYEAAETSDPRSGDPEVHRKWVTKFVTSVLRHAGRLNLRLPQAKLIELDALLNRTGA